MKKLLRAVVAGAVACAMLVPMSANAAWGGVTPQLANSDQTTSVSSPSKSDDSSSSTAKPSNGANGTKSSSSSVSSAPSSPSQTDPDSKPQANDPAGVSSSTNKLQQKQSDLPAAPSLGPNKNSTMNSVQGNAPPQQKPSPQISGMDTTTHDMLDTDAASVTQLKLSDRDPILTGTAPWDSDNAPGDDSDAHNMIVRSFDKITYNYDFAVSSDNDMTYYKSARVGFRFELPVTNDKAAFDLDAMGWVDQTPGYQPQSTTETIDGVPTQVFTAYRLLTPTSDNPTTVPGTAGISLTVDVRAAQQGDIIQPKVIAWAAPNNVQHRSMTNVPGPVTVSAKLNLNLRMDDWSSGNQNEISPEMSFDFNKSDPTYLNYGLGKRSGMIGKVNWAVDMRWPDQGKGLRGLEKPQGPVTFNVLASSRWQKNGSANPEPARADLQPYFWDYGSIDGNGSNGSRPFNDPGRDTKAQGWYPRYDNYNYAAPDPGDSSDHVYKNGSYNITQDRESDKTVFRFTLSNYDINGTFPYFGYAHNVDRCSAELMSSGCVTQTVGEISTGYLYVFFPTSIPDSGSPDGQKNVLDLYAPASLTLQSAVGDGGLSATSVSVGQGDNFPAATGADDVSNQASGSDDRWDESTLLTPPGSFDNRFYYSCPTSNTTEENGTDCGTWQARDWLHGTDAAMVGSTARIFVGSDFDTSKRELPVGVMNLIKIDPTVLTVPEKPDLDLHVKDASKPQGTPLWRDWESLDVFGNRPVDIFYATKKDGSSWTSDAEQYRADIDDLNLYDTKADAQAHGTIVAMLFVGHSAADTTKAGHQSKYDVGSFKAPIRPDARIGSVAQVTQRSYTFTRQQLFDAGKAVLQDGTRLDPMTSSDAQWELLANQMDPLTLRNTLTPQYSAPAPGSSYQKATYDSTHGYMGNDTGGIKYGDSLYISGEQPKVDKTVEQKSESGGVKSIYDLDKEQRTVDWALTGSVSTSAASASSGMTTEAYVSDTLPKGLHYVDGSAKLGGTYQPGGASGGTVSGGTPFAPAVTDNPDGTTTLKWTKSDVPVDGSKFVIHYQSTIGDASDPRLDVKNNDSFVNTVDIQSKRNMAAPDTTTGTEKTATISVSRTHASSIAIRANPLVADVHQPLGFTMMLGNMAQSEKEDPYAVNIMPYNGGTPVSAYSGTYQISSLIIKGSGGASVGSAVHPRVFFSTDTSLRGRTPTSITRAEMMGWHEATVADNGDGTATVTIPEGYGSPVAWGFTSDSLPSESRYDLTVGFTPSNNQATDLYTDRWMTDSNTVDAVTQVVQRSVSGIAWYDYNGDGIRGPEDKVLPGVNVSLVDRSGNPVTSLTDGVTPLTAVTDANGAYQISDIPAGSGYKLEFRPSASSDWRKFKVTVKDNPDAQRSTNSGSTADQAQTTADPLRSASIALADFPSAAVMQSARYDDTYENSGITQKLPMAPSIMSSGFKVQKTLNGRNGPWLSGEQYMFDIAAQGSAPAAGISGPVPASVTVTNGSVTTVAVDGTKFDLPGSYVYKVTEHATSQPGVTADASTPQSYLVTVTVADDMTTLTRTVTTSMKDDKGAVVSGDNATFTNRYVPALVSVTPKGSKVLVSTSGNSHAPLAAGEFGFTLAESSAPEGATAIAAQHATNAADGSIVFPSITFDKAGTYKFQMTEDSVSDSHISRDPSTYTLTYTVTDDQQHARLVVSDPVVTSDPAGSSTARFTNTYSPSDVSYEVTAMKSMTNIDPATHRVPAAGEFRFRLEAVGGTKAVGGASVAKADVPMPAGATDGAIELNNQVNGSVAFGGMQYAYPGVFNYKVSEVVPSHVSQDSTLGYDARSYDVAVTVIDHSGILQASAAVSLDHSPAVGNRIAFDNKYTPAPADVVLDAKKTMTGRPLVDREFSALLAPMSGNPADGAPSNGSQKKPFSKDTDSAGSVSFDALRFTRVGDWKYTVAEKRGTAGGVTYDGTVHNVLVHVVEDATAHKLIASVSLSHEGVPETAMTFHNSYTPAPVSAVVNASKEVRPSVGNTYRLKAGDFSFTLHRVSAPADADAQADVSASNADDGNIVLPAVSMNKTGDYVFTLSENATSVPGITRDATVYTVTYHVADDLHGHLIVNGRTLERLGASGSSHAASAEFANTYNPKSVAVLLGGVKSVRNTDPATHRAPADGEFRFELAALDGTDASGKVTASQVPMPDGVGDGGKTAENVGSAFSFRPISYTRPGTYRYRISELKGHDSTIQYDSRSYVVTVTVRDVAGVLAATTDRNVSDVAFENAYTPTSVDVSLPVGKRLDGRVLRDNEFAAILEPAAGNPEAGTGDGASQSVSGKDGTQDDSAKEAGDMNNGRTDGSHSLSAWFDRSVSCIPGSPSAVSATAVPTGSGVSAAVGELSGTQCGRAVLRMSYATAGVWRYTLSEAAGSEHGVTYDRSSYAVTVRVSEDQVAHALRAAVAVEHGGSPVNAVVFNNVYRPDSPQTPPAQHPSSSSAGKGPSEAGPVAGNGGEAASSAVSGDLHRPDSSASSPSSSPSAEQDASATGALSQTGDDVIVPVVLGLVLLLAGLALVLMRRRRA